MNIPALLVLGLLCAEMTAFILLVMPTTNGIRHAVVKFFETSIIAGKILHGFKIAIIGVSILFADGIRSVVQKHEVSTDMTLNDKVALGKMVAQRNLYLCGFSLFLALSVTPRCRARWHVLTILQCTVPNREYAP